MANFPRNDDLARRIEEAIKPEESKPKEDLSKLQKDFKKALKKPKKT